MKKPAFENPLIPHARMRALYRALTETRALSERLGKPFAVPRNLEACWVAAAIDLCPGDYALDAQGGALLTHMQRLGARPGTQAPTARSFTQALNAPATPFTGNPAERLLCAAGAAMAIRASGRPDAVLVFATQDELDPAAWTRVLALAAAEPLPLLLYALPTLRSRGKQSSAPRLDLERLASRAAGRAHPPVPVLPVDAGDTIALYRVTQESLVRARAGGGAVLIDCIDCNTDPLDLLARQLLDRGIATPRWIDAVRNSSPPQK